MPRNENIDRLREVREARKKLSRLNGHDAAAAGTSIFLAVGEKALVVETSFGVSVAPELHAALFAALDNALADREEWLLRELRAARDELKILFDREPPAPKDPCSASCKGWDFCCDDGHVEACDDCGIYDDDVAAALDVAKSLGAEVLVDPDGNPYIVNVQGDQTLSYIRSAADVDALGERTSPL